MSSRSSTIPQKFHHDLSRAVDVLRGHGAEAVYVFGSSIESVEGHEARDLDLAVSGLPARSFLHAYGVLLGELEHPFDLVDLDSDNRFSRRLLRAGKLKRVA